MKFDGLKDAIIQMIAGGNCKIDTNTFENDMIHFQSKDDVLTVLVHLGYLAYNAEKQEVSIPNEEAVAKGIDKVHMENTSILNYNNENALSCVISLAYYNAINEYTIVRELPTGKGYADVVFLPRKDSDKPAMVIELKWNRTAEGAIGQIKEKKYVQVLKNYKGNLLLVGINYDEKKKELYSGNGRRNQKA